MNAAKRTLAQQHPALFPALGLLCGAWLGLVLTHVSLPLVACLAAASLAWGGSRGAVGVLLALGLTLTSLTGDPRRVPAVVEPERPVTIEGTVLGTPVCRAAPPNPWAARDDSEGEAQSQARLRVSLLRQGSGQQIHVVPTRFDLFVTVPGCALVAGQRWRVRGHLRRSQGYRNPAPVEPGPWRMTVVSPRLMERLAPAGRAEVSRQRLRQRLLDLSTGPEAPRLVASLLLGDRSSLDPRWRQALRRAGLGHLLAVSGLHVAVLAGLVAWPTGFLGRRPRLLLVAATVVGYLWLLGPRPSVQRSALMALAAVLALLLERPPQALNALALAVMLLVLGDPTSVIDLGFQLSVAATSGILLVSPRLADWLPGPRPIAQALAVPLAAQLCTLPWTVGWVGGLHPLAPVLDLLAIPWLAVFLGLGALALIAIGLGFEPPWAPLVWLEQPVEALATLAPSPWLFLPLHVSSPGLPGLVLAGLWGGHWLLHESSKTRAMVDPGPEGDLAALKRPRLWMGFVAGLALFQLGARASDVTVPELVVLDVGQGDAILLRDGPTAVLVDGGGWHRGDIAERVLLSTLVAEGVHRLQAVVMTHPDRDHCAGLVDVARWLPVEEVWMSPGWRAACATRLVALPGSRWRPLWAGDRRRVGRWDFEVLHPVPGERVEGNDRSLVVRATVEGRGILLTGDVEAAGERRLLRRDPDRLTTTLLKVAHHGSKTSSRAAWLRAVAPRVALISAGRRNPYGHPAPSVVRRLEAEGILPLRTDRDGAIRWRFPVRGGEATEVGGI